MACCDITDKNLHGFRSGFTRNYSKYIQIQVTVILSYRQAAGGLNMYNYNLVRVQFKFPPFET